MYVAENGSGQISRVSEADCAAADSQWETDWESPDPCDHPYPPQGCDPGGPDSPIIVDLDGDRFHLAGLDSPVAFDIDNDGTSELLTWTRGGTLDAFLCLDRNGNGRIDGGRELFGNHTPLLDGSTAEHGYVALAELDSLAAGGNHNGFIDRQDAIYKSLCLWIDWNHTGVSDPGEILSLEDAGLVRMAVRARQSRRTDEHGNEFRYISRAWLRIDGHTWPIWTSDVFFVER